MEIQPVYMNTNDMEQFVKVEKTEVKQNVTSLIDLGVENELDSK